MKLVPVDAEAFHQLPSYDVEGAAATLLKHLRGKTKLEECEAALLEYAETAENQDEASQELHQTNAGLQQLRIEAHKLATISSVQFLRSTHTPPKVHPCPSFPTSKVCDDEGCGFVAIELQRVKWSLLIVTVYLKSGVGLTGGPNPTILGSLRPHLRPYHNWLAVGDWNVAVEDMQDTSFCSSIGGSIVAANCSAFEGGNELDYGISSRNLCSLLSAEVDWGVPFKPHAAVRFSLDVPSGQLALPQLQGFKGSIKEDDPGPVPQRPVELGMIGTVPLRQDCMTVAFAAFAQQAADRHFGEADGRGILTIPPRTSL